MENVINAKNTLHQIKSKDSVLCQSATGQLLNKTTAIELTKKVNVNHAQILQYQVLVQAGENVRSQLLSTRDVTQTLTLLKLDSVHLANHSTVETGRTRKKQAKHVSDTPVNLTKQSNLTVTVINVVMAKRLIHTMTTRLAGHIYTAVL